MIRALLGVGAVIILFAALKWWALGAVVFAAALWGFNKMGTAAGDATHAENVRQAGLAHRAEEQHKAIVLDGDYSKGVYGTYTPAVPSESIDGLKTQKNGHPRSTPGE